MYILLISTFFICIFYSSRNRQAGCGSLAVSQWRVENRGWAAPTSVDNYSRSTGELIAMKKVVFFLSKSLDEPKNSVGSVPLSQLARCPPLSSSSSRVGSSRNSITPGSVSRTLIRTPTLREIAHACPGHRVHDWRPKEEEKTAVI